MKPGDARGIVQVKVGDQVIVETLRVARTPWLRFRGLMFRSTVPEAFGDGLLFPRCRSLHTFGMRFALDIAFLQDDGRVEALLKSVPPGRTAVGPRSARHSLEVTAGKLNGVRVGDLLTFPTA